MNKNQRIISICLIFPYFGIFVTSFAFRYQWNVGFPMTGHQLHVFNIIKIKNEKSLNIE